MTLSPDDFDYPLDERLIAQQPLERRDQSRLMVLDRAGGGVSHRVFGDLPELLRPGDLLVLNDTAVIPAKFAAFRASGGRIEGLFLREPSRGRWEVLLRNAQKCRAGEPLTLPGSGVTLRICESLGEGKYVLASDPPAAAMEVLGAIGRTPLPPYIRRGEADAQADRGRYQTVYAAVPGAVAAPTAGLHFTPELLEALRARGVAHARVTLHVGMGTFLPVKSADLASHEMHSEWYDLSPQAAEAINLARREGRRIVAVGTTSVRVLETVARSAGVAGAGSRTDLLAPGSGWTDIFLYPPCSFLATDALVTNFHLPRSTLLMLVAAFCSPGRTDGIETIRRAYLEAAARQYRFFSYGDAMLIE